MEQQGLQADESSGPDDSQAVAFNKRKQAQPARDRSIGANQSIASDKENQHSCRQKLCFACNQSLANSPQLINVAGRSNWWHPECFRCFICHARLDKETSCHTYKERIVCRADYAKLQRDFSVKCSRCRWPIGASDWVRKAGEFIYHLACFTCDICQRQLSTGEQFTISTQEEKSQVRLLCRLHFTLPQAQPNHSPISAHQVTGLRSSPCTWHAGPGSSSQASHRPLASEYQSLDGSQPGASDDYLQMLTCAISNDTISTNAMGINLASGSDLAPLDSGPSPGSDFSPVCRPSSATGCPMSQKMLHMSSSPTGEGTSSTASGSSPNSNANTVGPNLVAGSSSSSKSKRVRTTFTEEQLSILQNQFQIDSNPDGQDLERIATITGLSKRVTQVWFQNSRARQKKYMIKRKPASSSSSCPSALAAGAQQQQLAASQLQSFDNQLFLANHQVTGSWSVRREQSSFERDKVQAEKWSLLECGSALELGDEPGRLALADLAHETARSPVLDQTDHHSSSDGSQNDEEISALEEDE